ncbi:MAG: alanine dehydrogenase [Verrucomicrobia bacterium]|nr:alanine dehydrogenase [Verrucomicrobiota bacterium]
MIVGAPKEIKDHEYRVSLLPFGVELLVKAGHQVVVQTMAGEGSGVTDDEYARAGAKVVKTAQEVFKAADLIVKVKEPQPAEYSMLKPGQVVFTYFHFAASRELTDGMVDAKIIAIAYETIALDDGTLPLLTPMSEVAGRMAIQEGAKYLEKPFKGRGMLLAGVPGVEPARVVIIGGGVVGTNAAKMAGGLGADVTILDISLPRLRYLDDVMPPNVKTMMSNPWNLRRVVKEADLLVGAVLVTGDRAPILVTKEMISTMKKGAVIVDVAVDQGGCVETTKPTTHSEPTFIVHDVVHYCVANMPGAVARTSTYALCNATFPYLLELANKGYKQAARDDRAIALGLNMVEGQVVYREVAQLFGLPYVELQKVLG